MRYFLFALLLLAAGSAGAQNIIGYEYWFNADGMNGQRVFVPAGNAPVVDLNNLSIPLGTLPIGHHKIHYRLKDSNGRWSSVISKPVTRLVGGPYEITGGEYWFDTSTDRTPFILGPGQTISANIAPDVSGLQQGPHKIHYRLRDNHGFWSSVISKPFSVFPGGPYELVLLRYWSDQDATNPSDMTVVPIAPGVQYLNIIDDVLFCNWSQTGSTDVYFQLKDNHEQWSSVITRNYDVTGSIPLVSAPTFVAPNLNPLFGASLTYTVTAIPGAAGYEWTLPDGWTGSSTANSINVQVGNENNAWQLCVRAYNGCGFGEQTCLDITTGVGQLVQQGGIGLYPNPTTGQFQLLCDKSQPITRLMVFSPTGQLVRDLQPAQSDRYVLDLSNEAIGLYTVRVLHANETTQLRVMVQY